MFIGSSFFRCITHTPRTYCARKRCISPKNNRIGLTHTHTHMHTFLQSSRFISSLFVIVTYVVCVCALPCHAIISYSVCGFIDDDSVGLPLVGKIVSEEFFFSFSVSINLIKFRLFIEIFALFQYPCVRCSEIV